ncbi:SDR family oxidoreductase [Microcella sp.]|uniref:SDR family oxidoreductase n=1 Tax=Microcella sp. TaxID=1913979 RepID=UPI00391ACCD2
MANATDPRNAHPDEFDEQKQDSQPGHLSEMSPAPDHGERSYRGHGKLEGRCALISGGDSGIGRAVAIAYAREGADVALIHLPEEEDDAASTAELVADAGRRVLTIAGDVRDEDFCRDAVARTVDTLGGLDILVLNAAYQQDRDGIESITTEEWDRVMRTNLYSMLWLTAAARPHLHDGSSIITTTSVQAFNPSPQLVDYAMTKAAQVAFTKALAQDLGEAGIRVNAVAPGPIWTPLIPATDWPEEKIAEFGSDTPLGRAGQPAELAGAYVYLASDDATYVSGAILAVTGGKPL